ncbi:hypothetical protein ACE6H2_010947 [Prunus campanulata]
MNFRIEMRYLEITWIIVFLQGYSYGKRDFWVLMIIFHINGFTLVVLNLRFYNKD